MRGLRKYLTPFAPDQSGAVSVLYELGGLIAICDAGGCTGNVCGFDEPRWFEKKSALFSAGLRDMDAILGRDDRLVEKLVDAASKLDVNFVAIIGTPVPAVIGTDYYALGRMCEKKLNMPVMTIDTDGMELYDVGEEKAWLALFQTFAGKTADECEESCAPKDSEDLAEEACAPENSGRIGILGLTPQDTSDLRTPEKIRKYYQKNGKEAICYCMGTGTSEDSCGHLYGLENVCVAGNVEKNIVVSPAALKTAKYLEQTFGTPYEVGYPIAEELVPEMDYQGKKILIVYQQVIGNAIRAEIRCRCQKVGKVECADKKADALNPGNADSCRDTEITVASWFMMKPELSETGDISLREEDDYMELIQKENYDIVFADPMMKRMTEDAYQKNMEMQDQNRMPEAEQKWIFIESTHFAVSGKLCEEVKKQEA